MPRNRPHRIVFYINDSQFQRLNDAIEKSGLERADWLRTAVDGAATVAPQGINGTSRGITEVPAELAAAQERVRGLEELVQQQRERQGMSDALNQELSQRLKESHATLDGFRLMLPAAGETGRRWWRFW